MTDSVPDRPRPSDESGPRVLLGDVTASSVTAWSVLGELRAPAVGTGRTRPSSRTPPPPPPPRSTPVEPARERTPGPGVRSPSPGSRRPESREQGQQREKLAQRDRQVVAQEARDEDTRRRQERPGSPSAARPVRRVAPQPTRPAQPAGSAQRRLPRSPARQAQPPARWTAQPTARGAPQRSTAPGGERRQASPVRIVGVVVVVLVLAGRCLSGLT